MIALVSKAIIDNGKVKVKTIEASLRCNEGKKESDVLELVVRGTRTYV